MAGAVRTASTDQKIIRPAAPPLGHVRQQTTTNNTTTSSFIPFFLISIPTPNNTTSQGGRNTTSQGGSTFNFNFIEHHTTPIQQRQQNYININNYYYPTHQKILQTLFRTSRISTTSSVNQNFNFILLSLSMLLLKHVRLSSSFARNFPGCAMAQFSSIGTCWEMALRQITKIYLIGIGIRTQSKFSARLFIAFLHLSLLRLSNRWSNFFLL